MRIVPTRTACTLTLRSMHLAPYRERPTASVQKDMELPERTGEDRPWRSMKRGAAVSIVVALACAISAPARATAPSRRAIQGKLGVHRRDLSVPSLQPT